jgi:hypothetical protein
VVALEVTFGETDSTTVLGASNPTAAKTGSSSTVVAAAVASNGNSTAEQNDALYAAAVAGSLDPLNVDGVWSNFSAAAGRFGPWVALLGIAFVIEAVARSAMRDRLRAKGSGRA